MFVVYRAILEKLLNVSAEAAASQFGSALFTQETAMSMEGDEAIFTSNTGVNTRYKMTEKSAEVEMCDMLHKQLFCHRSQPNPIPSRRRLKIRRV